MVDKKKRDFKGEAYEEIKRIFNQLGKKLKRKREDDARGNVRETGGGTESR